MAKKSKSITTLVKNKSKDPNADPYHRRVGIEATLSNNPPEMFEHWGNDYCSFTRRAIKDFQSGAEKNK